MSGQANAIGTRGVICKGGSRTIIRIFRCVLPFNLQLKRDLFKVNLKLQDTINLNTLIDQNKINLLKLDPFKFNTNVPDLKINLKKCED